MKLQAARSTMIVAALVGMVSPSPAMAWGKTGHRVVAAIADQQLSGLARAHVKEIIGLSLRYGLMSRETS